MDTFSAFWTLFHSEGHRDTIGSKKAAFLEKGHFLDIFPNQKPNVFIFFIFFINTTAFNMYFTFKLW